MAQLPPELADYSGQTLKGYELRELIGQGGFGVVYRAYQPVIDREVALKIILPRYANNPVFIRRFETEARLIARLDHIHIVPLYDYWREPDIACLVMRWLRGGSLHALLERQGALELPLVGKLLEQIAGALSAAHRNGVVHRDLKPANILLDEETNAYLADFGIAKILSPDAPAVVDDDRYGSPDYVSPEQVTGQPISPLTDIYSLGVVLYTMLTGKKPFSDPSTTTIIRKHLYESLPPLQTERPDLPHALNIVIWRATSKQPEARYPDALSLVSDFHRITRSQETSARILANLAAPPPPARVLSQLPQQTIDLNVPADPQNPYKGLRAFEEADAADFFGRGATVERLVKRLSETGVERRFLAVVGPSGSGKSSVVKAGLIPALRQGVLFGSQNWLIVELVPGVEPFAALEAALLKVAVTVPDRFSERLRNSAGGLTELINEILPDGVPELALVIDQFEEVYTLTADDAARARFLDSLAHLVTAPDSRARLIITLRADFYDRPLQHPGFAPLMREQTELILPMTLGEMERAIISPAERQFLRFEPGLVEAIINDVNQQPGALPLLQYALTELFERREGFTLTQAAYAAIGGVSGALGRRAEEIYQQFDTGDRDIARQVFLRLVTVSAEGEATRRRGLQSELLTLSTDRARLQQVIAAFGQARLLTFDYEPVSHAPTVEIAHEALLRVWERLRDWLDTGREDLLVHRRLALAASAWDGARRDASFLATGTQLAQYERLMTNRTLTLNDSEIGYLQASLAGRQRAARRIRLFIAILIGLTAAAIGLSLVALDREAAAVAERNRADAEARTSRSRELAMTALAGDVPPDLALLLSLEALRTADTFEARNSLLLALQAQPQLSRFLHTDAPVRSLAFSPDGRWLVTGDLNHRLMVWDATTGERLAQSNAGHSDRINAVAFSPDNTTIASASSDGTLRLWRVADNGAALELQGEPLVGHGDAVWAAAFSPDGTLLVSGGADGAVRLWDAGSGAAVGQPIETNNETVYSIVFRQDGQMLVSAGDSGTIQRWLVSPDDGAALEAAGEPLSGHNNWVLAAAFSPDGQRLATAGADRQILLWDVTSRQAVGQISTGHADWIRSLAFSPSGALLASASQDHTLRLWSMETGDLVGQPLAAHADAVYSAAFRPDSDTLVSGGADGSVIFWQTNVRQPFEQVLGTHGDPVLAVAFSPDGRQLASGGGSLTEPVSDTAIRLWDVTTGQETRALQGQQRYITALAYSPDGTRLASASGDQTLALWNPAGGQAVQTWNNPNGRKPLALAFSPDGRLLVAGDDSGAIVFRDGATGQALGSPVTAHRDEVLSLTVSPDGKTLASGSRDGTIALWDATTRQARVQPQAAHNGTVASLDYSPDGRILASGSSDGTVVLRDAATLQPLGQPLVIGDEVSSVVFSPDGTTLAVGSLDSSISLWDVATGQRLGQPFIGHRDWVTDVAFAPDGNLLASVSVDRSVALWDMSLDSWRARACQIAHRNFSPDEWERFFREVPYRETCPAAR
ncbi:MAG: protein kinase [Chloroflexi bacterium]|nr:protein kinase [Chloroflexota bacterium]